MKAAIIGAGSVGLAVGSCLSQAGCEVTFVTRPGGDRELHEHGLWRSGIFGDVRVSPDRIDVVDHVSRLGTLSAPDFVLVCTKTFASTEIATTLSALWCRWGEQPPAVVLFHNGWGSADIFASRLPEEHLFNARVITGFRRTAPVSVEITVHAEPIRIGSLYGEDPVRVAPLAHAIATGGIPCEISREIARDLWAKLLYNCALNPLGALQGLPYGELAARARNREIMDAAVREVFAVMHADGWTTHWPSAREYLPVFYDELLPPTASHESSMLQDLRAGRRTEVDALCGAVVALGKKHGIVTPVNAALSDLVRAIEDKKKCASAPRREGRVA